MPSLSSNSINSSLQLPVVVYWHKMKRSMWSFHCVLSEQFGWMLRILFQKSYLRFVTIVKLSQWRGTTSLWTDSPVTVTKLLYLIMFEFGRTVAILLNPFSVKFRPKMRTSHSQDESPPRFWENPHEWAYDVTSREDIIVRRSRDLRIELCALETTILPGSFANAFDCTLATSKWAVCRTNTWIFRSW